MIKLNYVVLYTNVLHRALLCAGMCAVKWHLRPATLTSLFSPFQCEGGLVLDASDHSSTYFILLAHINQFRTFSLVLFFFSLFQRQAINPLYSITRFIHYCGGFCGFIWSSVFLKAILHSSSIVSRRTFFFFFSSLKIQRCLRCKWRAFPQHTALYESAWRLHGGCVAIIFRHWTSFRRPLSALSQTFSFQSKVDQLRRKVQSVHFTFSFPPFLPPFIANDQKKSMW